MIQTVRKYVKDNQILQKGEHLVVGVSGGADSVCLLDILCQLRGEYDLTLTVVHIEHGIRGAESLRDMEFVKELCAERNISCFCEQFPVKEIAREQGLSVEEAGRMVRYEAFQRILQQVKGDKIAVAHHGDDLAETMLFFLSRGTGVAGLVPMKPVQEMVVRPLLCVTREEIEAYLAQRGLSYCIDATNNEMEYARNRIRHQVIPELKRINGQAVKHFVQTAQKVADAQEVLEEASKQAFSQWAQAVEEGFLLRGELVSKEKPYLQYQVVSMAMEAVCHQRKDLEQVHFQQVLELFKLQVGRQIDLPYGMTAKREYAGVLICHKNMLPIEGCGTALQKEWKVTVPGNYTFEDGRRVRTRFVEDGEKLENIPTKTYTKWFDYDIIKDNLCIRISDSLDYLVIDDKGGRKKLKKLFVDEKIPRQDRGQVLVLANAEHVFWALGVRMGEDAKITNQTKCIVEISVDGGENNERND